MKDHINIDFIFRTRFPVHRNNSILSIFILFIFSGIAFGQEAQMNSKSIQSNFSQKSILAYQENSQNKLKEFYEYLSLYSSEKDENLKNQIRENIFALTKKGMQIPDFLSADSKEIDLLEFLSKIENQSVLFEIKTIGNSGETEMNQWTNSFVLSVKTKDSSNNFEVKQIIHFEPKEKRFGSKTKTVWDMKLMDVILN